MSKEVMDVKEVAEYLGIAESTVYKWVEYREIPFTKVGSLLRFPKWLIDRHLSDRAVYPEESLYDEFVRLHSRYHLEKFLQSKGLDSEKMTEEQLFDELKRAIKALKAEEGRE